MGGTKWLAQGLSWLSTLVVARLLRQEDYGIVAMAGTYIGLVQLVGEFGLGAAVVQRRDLTPNQISKLATLSLLFGMGGAVLSVILAQPVAAFFDTAELRLVIMVLSLTFLISGLQVIPRSLLAQEYRFRSLATIEAAESLALTGLTITLALLGTGYWALVLGAIGARALSTGMLLVTRHHPIAWPTPLSDIRDALSFGWHMVAGNLAWYAFRNADMAIIGRILGKAALGAYSVGFNLASVPVDRVVGLVSRVTPTILATVQSEPRLLRRYLLGLTEGVAIATMPLAVGMALVASDFVVTVIGAKWEPAIGPLMILSLAAVSRSLVSLPAQVLVATGHPRLNARGTFLIAIVLSPLFLLGSRWGIVGVAAVWLTAYPLIAGISIVRPALLVAHCTWREYLGSLGPAASGCAGMAAVVGTLILILPASFSMGARLAIKVIAGAVTYFAVMGMFHRSRIRTVLALFRNNPPDATG